MKKLRIEFIDIAKGVGILCVISGHLLGEGNISFTGSAKLREAIYYFHMPLFFVISGILLWNLSGDHEYSLEFVKKRLKRTIKTLLFPYFIWNIIYFILNDIGQKQNIKDWFPYIITFRGVAPLWFLAALFIAGLTLLLILCIAKNIHTQLFCLFVLYFLIKVSAGVRGNYKSNTIWMEFFIITIGRNFVCTFFMLLGWILAEYIIIMKDRRVIMAILFAMIFLFGILIHEIGGVNLHLFSIKDTDTFLLLGSIGTFGIIALSKMIESFQCSTKIKCKESILGRIGRNSLGIMILHYPPFPFIRYAISICSCMGIESGVIRFVMVLLLVVLISDISARCIKARCLI